MPRERRSESAEEQGHDEQAPRRMPTPTAPPVILYPGMGAIAARKVQAILAGHHTRQDIVDYMRDMDELYPGLGWREQSDRLAAMLVPLSDFPSVRSSVRCSDSASV